MKLVLLALLSISMVGCYQTKQGNLDVLNTIKLKDNKGKVVTLRPGNFAAKLKLKSKRKFQLVIPQLNKKFKFKVPRGIKLPRTYGELRLSSRELKQPIDVDLFADRRTLESDTYSVVERCSQTRTTRVCRNVRTPARRECRNYPDGSRRCRTYPPRNRRVCRNENRTIWGNRTVTYRDVTRENIFTADIYSPGTNDLIGKFDSTQVSRDRVTVSNGFCQITGPFPPLIERRRTTRRNF